MEPLIGSPLLVHAFDPSSIQIMNFPTKIYKNTMNSFLIDPTLAGKGSLKIIIKGSWINIYTTQVYLLASLDPSNRSLPITVQKQSNHQIVVQFEPIVSGIFAKQE